MGGGVYSLRKSPEAGAHLAGSRNSKEARRRWGWNNE